MSMSEAAIQRPGSVSPPISAEALPAFLEKGASANAAPFGLISPMQDKYKNNIRMVP